MSVCAELSPSDSYGVGILLKVTELWSEDPPEELKTEGGNIERGSQVSAAPAPFTPFGAADHPLSSP